jgi:hypothetical protein
MIHQPLVGCVVRLLKAQGEGVLQAGLQVLPEIQRKFGCLPCPNGDTCHGIWLQQVTGIKFFGLFKPGDPGPKVVELATGTL